MTVYPCLEDEANTQLTKYKIIKGMAKEVPNILVTVRIQWDVFDCTTRRLKSLPSTDRCTFTFLKRKSNRHYYGLK